MHVLQPLMGKIMTPGSIAGIGMLQSEHADCCMGQAAHWQKVILAFVRDRVYANSEDARNSPGVVLQ